MARGILDQEFLSFDNAFQWGFDVFSMTEGPSETYQVADHIDPISYKLQTSCSFSAAELTYALELDTSYAFVNFRDQGGYDQTIEINAKAADQYMLDNGDL